MKSRCLWVALVLFLFLSTGCSSTDIGIASDKIDTKIPSDAKIEKTFDDHGGFHGDGEYFVVISLSNKQYQEFYERIKSNEKWQNMPIQTDVHQSLYGFEKSEKDTLYINERALPEELPDIKKGKFFFVIGT